MAMARKKVLVLGGNFGGLTAAIAVRHELAGDVDVLLRHGVGDLEPGDDERRVANPEPAPGERRIGRHHPAAGLRHDDLTGGRRSGGDHLERHAVDVRLGRRRRERDPRQVVGRPAQQLPVPAPVAVAHQEGVRQPDPAEEELDDAGGAGIGHGVEHLGELEVHWSSSP